MRARIAHCAQLVIRLDVDKERNQTKESGHTHCTLKCRRKLWFDLQTVVAVMNLSNCEMDHIPRGTPYQRRQYVTVQVHIPVVVSGRGIGTAAD